jgi:hypothetical protein
MQGLRVMNPGLYAFNQELMSDLISMIYLNNEFLQAVIVDVVLIDEAAYAGLFQPFDPVLSDRASTALPTW